MQKSCKNARFRRAFLHNVIFCTLLPFIPAPVLPDNRFRPSSWYSFSAFSTSPRLPAPSSVSSRTGWRRAAPPPASGYCRKVSTPPTYIVSPAPRPPARGRSVLFSDLSDRCSPRSPALPPARPAPAPRVFPGYFPGWRENSAQKYF